MLALFVATLVTSAFAKPVASPAQPAAQLVIQTHGQIKFLSASAPSKTPLEALIRGEPVAFGPPIHHVKLSIVFEKPLPVARVVIQSCGADWEDGIEMFTMPGLTRTFSEGGKNQLDLKLPSLPTTPLTRSIAILFGKDAQLCLKSFAIFDQKNQPLVLESATPISATLSKDEGRILFDGHPETEMAFEEPLTIQFGEKQKFDRAKIATGGTPLYAHSLKLTGEKGWSETLPLRSTSAEQEIVFKKPFDGQKLTISSPGGGEIGEIRFAEGTKVQVLNLPAVARHHFANVFDSTWITDSTSDDRWTFVLRSDGTFFVKGLNDDPKQAREYAGVGGFTIVRQNERELKLKLKGVRFPTAIKWDGVMCPFSCGEEGSSDSPLTDTLVFEANQDGTLMARNRTPRAHRTLMFGDLKLHKPADD